MIKDIEGLERWIDRHGGVVGVSEIAVAFDVPEHLVRQSAPRCKTRRVGGTYAFTFESAACLMALLAAAERAVEDDTDEDDTDEDDTDEDDTDEDDTDDDDD